MKHIITLKKSHKSESVHYNFATNTGKVYCKKENKVISLEKADCRNCKYFYGSCNGYGVECIWEDDKDKEVYNPYSEYHRVNNTNNN